MPYLPSQALLKTIGLPKKAQLAPRHKALTTSEPFLIPPST